MADAVVSQAISGSESFRCAQGPGGSESWYNIGAFRNGSAIQVFSGSGPVTYTATLADSTLQWKGTAQDFDVQLPNPAYDGQIIQFSTDTTLTTRVTVTVATSPQNQTIQAAFSDQTLTAGTNLIWQFSLSALEWFRIK